jgi:hypothetical protein
MEWFGVDDGIRTRGLQGHNLLGEGTKAASQAPRSDQCGSPFFAASAAEIEDDHALLERFPWARPSSPSIE